MPRKYEKKKGARPYKNYTDDTIKTAMEAIRRGMSYSDASALYKIPVRTLYYKVKGQHAGTVGGQQCLTDVEERHLVDVLIACAEYGAPLTTFDLKMTVKHYLNKQGRAVKQFKNGATPGKDWCYNFLDRHKNRLTQRACQNIKEVRAKKTEEEFAEYFENLARSIEGVPPENILNFDETNLTDNPGAKKCIFRRGIKYAERVMNTSKSAISIMFAATASGEMLPPYVVYKAERLYDLWCTGGPKNTKYNRTKSGWFDAATFQDWFERLALPWAKQLPGRKVLIGDNLSSHVQLEILRECQRNNIIFVFLPPHSTHLTQPLDVGFFRSLKQHWRNIITTYKIKNPKNSTVDKNSFPQLLKILMTKISENQENVIKNSFKAAGIVPLNPDAVLKKLPSRRLEDNVKEDIGDALLNYLKQTRSADTPSKPKRSKKMLQIAPGKSISYEELIRSSDSNSEDFSEDDKESDSGQEEVDQTDERIPMEAQVEDDRLVDTLNSVEPEEQQSKIIVGSFVIVQFVTKKTCKHFVGEVLNIMEDDYNVKFMRKCFTNGFVFPQVDDISLVKEQDIIKHLETPSEVRRGIYRFRCDLSSYLM